MWILQPLHYQACCHHSFWFFEDMGPSEELIKLSFMSNMATWNDNKTTLSNWQIMKQLTVCKYLHNNHESKKVTIISIFILILRFWLSTKIMQNNIQYIYILYIYIYVYKIDINNHIVCYKHKTCKLMHKSKYWYRFKIFNMYDICSYIIDVPLSICRKCWK